MTSALWVPREEFVRALGADPDPRAVGTRVWECGEPWLSSAIDVAQDPSVVLAELVDWMRLLERNCHLDVDADGDDTRIVWRETDDIAPHAAVCAFRAGAIEALVARCAPGEVIDVDHEACVCLGDPACVFRVDGWIPVRDARHARLLREVSLQAVRLASREAFFRRIEELGARSTPFPDVQGLESVRRFIEEVEDIVMVFDADFSLIDANRAACRFFEMTLDELRGMTARDLLSDRSLEVVVAAAPMFRDVGSLRGVQLEARTRHGTATIEVSARMSESRESIVCLARDITSRLALERELADRNVQLQGQNIRIAEGDRLKSEFVANVTHELTTPLTCIKGFAKLLNGHITAESGGAGTRLPIEKRAEFVALIESEADRMLELIRDLLDLSNLGAGGVKLDRAWVALNPLIDACLQVLKPRLDEAHLSIQTRYDPALPDCEIDAARIKQVVMNLVDNAIKFSRPGAMLGVATRRTANAVQIRVRNPTEDLSPTDLERVFGRFVQRDGSFRRPQGGVGLGLDLVRAIAELHGGRAWAELPRAGLVEFACELPVRFR